MSRAVGVAVAALLAVAAPAAARACPDRAPEGELGTWRFAIGAPDGAALGLDAVTDGPSGGWGRCDGVGHRVVSITTEMPRVAEDSPVVFRLAGYRARLGRGHLGIELGAHLATVWDGQWRFVTPMAAVTARPLAELELRIDAAWAGVFVMAPRGVARRWRDDVAVAARAAWPADRAVRGELRVGIRDYALRMPVRDVTVAAGLGVARAVRGGVRAVPGFLGVAVRGGERPAVMAVVELTIGLAR